MPPIDTTPQSQNRYFKRLLSALTIQAGGELRIPLKLIRKVIAEQNPQGLFEDTNVDTDELVLRFGTKNSAVYTVEPEPICDSPKPQSARLTAEVPQPSPSKGRLPLTDDQLSRMQVKLNQMKAAAALKRGREQANSSVPSELNFPD